MEVVPLDPELTHLLRRDLPTRRVPTPVDRCCDDEAATVRGVADQTHHCFIGAEWLAAPVHRDEREETVFDLVPLARAGGKWLTWIGRPTSSARRCSSNFHTRARYPLLPPASAVMKISVASGYRLLPIRLHHA